MEESNLRDEQNRDRGNLEEECEKIDILHPMNSDLEESVGKHFHSNNIHNSK